MRYLHARTPQCLHRDLKSGNLLVNEGFVVKVSDFGTGALVDLGNASRKPVRRQSRSTPTKLSRRRSKSGEEGAEMRSWLKLFARQLYAFSFSQTARSRSVSRR